MCVGVSVCVREIWESYIYSDPLTAPSHFLEHYSTLTVRRRPACTATVIRFPSELCVVVIFGIVCAVLTFKRNIQYAAPCDREIKLQGRRHRESCQSFYLA